MWEVSSSDFFCKRIMQKADEVDIPIRMFQDGGKSCFYPSKPISTEEEQIFPLYKDYSSLLSIFHILQQDVPFIYQNNIAFLHRRIRDFNHYNKPALLYGYIPLRIEPLA